MLAHVQVNSIAAGEVGTVCGIHAGDTSTSLRSNLGVKVVGSVGTAVGLGNVILIVSMVPWSIVPRAYFEGLLRPVGPLVN